MQRLQGLVEYTSFLGLCRTPNFGIVQTPFLQLEPVLCSQGPVLSARGHEHERWRVEILHVRSLNLTSLESILAAMDTTAFMDCQGLHSATICQGSLSITPLCGEVRSVYNILLRKLE